MQTQWLGCHSANFTPGRRGFHPEAIVIHSLPGSMADAQKMVFDPASQQSAHYAVSLTGDVQQFVDETDTAFHAGVVVLPDWPLLKANGANPNFYTIGIELESSSGQPWPGPQAFAATLLVSEIVARWGIPFDDDHVIPHRRLRASRNCPAEGVDLSRLFRPNSPYPPQPAAPAKLTLRSTSTVHVRYQHPNTASPIFETCPPNTEITATSFTLGERVHGNPYWYADAHGNYIWAGATNKPNPNLN
jgi:hypothetical protein